MMQADAYLLGIRLLNNAGAIVTPQDVQQVEITIGNLRRTYSEGDLSFHDGLWMFPLSQQQTLAMVSTPKAQVRVKWANGAVEGKPLYGVCFEESISREVL